MQLELVKIEWHIINDAVMGGLSRSVFSLDAAGLHFGGSLSTAHGGGFASIRGSLNAPLDRFTGIRLSLTGDGRSYQLRLRETDDPGDIAWRASFATHGARETITLGASDFEPVFRGRRVEALPGLADRAMHHVGLMLASRQEGAFALTVHSIETIDMERYDD
jgi:NADH dehydrogenase [ubiquinone] 1 alpha subcomplex assembly factor 1